MIKLTKIDSPKINSALKFSLRTASLFVLGFGLNSCRQAHDGPWLGAQLSPWLTVHTDGVKDPLDVWRSSGLRLTLKDFALQGEAASFARRHKLVMVSFPFQSELAAQLASDPLTLFHFEGDAEHSGWAAVVLPDPMVREGLALSAHAANNHACGNMVPLTLNTLAVEARITPPIYASEVPLQGLDTLLAEPKEANIETTINALAAMGTRYFTSQSGIKTPDELEKMFVAAADGKITGFTVDHIAHQESDQKSLVVTIPGTEDNDTTVIVGAHLDSINSGNRTGPAPGADDDASGIATLIEMTRAIAATGAQFKRKIEFHAYGAEEVGLVGSSEIATSYDAAGRKVAAMLQIDMNSWNAVAGASTIYLVKTDTSMTLRRSVKDVLTSYLGGDYQEKVLEHGTSDHRSWTTMAYPAVFPFEDPLNYNKALHTTSDTRATINDLGLSERFAKLGVAFLAHEAGLVSAGATYDQGVAALKAAASKDLKLAISPTEFDGYYAVSVAGPDQVKTVELCQISGVGALSCSKERLGSTAAKTDAGRNFYATEQSMAIDADARLAVFGYDERDKLVAVRTVHLRKK